jgi:hypothetical protein
MARLAGWNVRRLRVPQTTRRGGWQSVRPTDKATLDLFAEFSATFPPAHPPSFRNRRSADGFAAVRRVKRRRQPVRAPSYHLNLQGVAVQLTHKRIKHLRLSVHPPAGDVRVSAPLGLTTDAIRQFVIGRLDWILTQQRKLQARETQRPDAYVDGEYHSVWGQQRPLMVIERDAAPLVELKDGILLLHARPGSSAGERRVLLTEWYRSLVEASARPRIAAWEPLMQVTVARVSARIMKTRWGSCSPHSGHIRLSTELGKKPPHILEYVVVHEMVHLLEASHNRRFRLLMDRFMPDWRVRRTELNGRAIGSG